MFETLVAFLKALAAFLTSIGINPAHLIAGIAGAIVRAVIQGKKLTWDLISYVLVGALCATYLTPVVVMYFGIAATNGLAFGIGLIGMSIAEGAVKLAQKWAANPKLPKNTTPKDLIELIVKDGDKNKE